MNTDRLPLGYKDYRDAEEGPYGFAVADFYKREADDSFRFKDTLVKAEFKEYGVNFVYIRTSEQTQAGLAEYLRKEAQSLGYRVYTKLDVSTLTCPTIHAV